VSEQDISELCGSNRFWECRAVMMYFILEIREWQALEVEKSVLEMVVIQLEGKLGFELGVVSLYVLYHSGKSGHYPTNKQKKRKGNK